jgi:hypothetical protein
MCHWRLRFANPPTTPFASRPDIARINRLQTGKLFTALKLVGEIYYWVYPPVVPPTQGVRSRRHRAGRDRRPARCLVTNTREAPRQHRQSATAHVRQGHAPLKTVAERANALRETREHRPTVQRSKDSPRRARGQKIAEVERREASVPRLRGLRELIRAGTQGRAISPCGPASMAREGVAIHPERLSALRSLARARGK